MLSRIPIETRARFARLATLTAVLAYFLVVSGNIVRVTESGLGCPDWPFCYGSPIPAAHAPAIIEMAHRFFAGSVSILIVVLAVRTLRGRYAPRMSALSWLLLAVLAVQVLLGALTVWLLLAWWTVAAHLGTGMLTLGAVVTMAWYWRGRSRLVAGAGIAAVMVFLLLLSGGSVSGTGTALGCGAQFPQGWPLCAGSLEPYVNSTAFAQWLHRGWAAITAVVVWWVAARAWKHGGPARHWALAAGIGILVQAALGALMVLNLRPLPLATLHNATAAFTWVALLGVRDQG